MQEALLALTKYWTDKGCMIMQPFNTEVGAGTANPATFLRVLGPEPWHVAYVEPSVRPDDSRYGENPNRLQMHTQFQVILKPEPGDPQELYLGSLQALGIDPAIHDVRFVEDNWAQPAIGAWGLGWEVWLDGLEITQFTYFQQVGGKTMDPVPVELTYGVERILMALQGVSHVKDIAYAKGISYGEVFGQAEYEMSTYYLDEADVSANRELFERYAAEADRLVAERLPVPAYSYVLKCSHAFNVLDARGAISTTERAKAFARMRTLARDVAGLWLERREELGHPLGVVTSAGKVAEDAEPLLDPVCNLPLPGPAPLLFEIGTEELPPHEVRDTVAAVRSAMENKLDDTRLGHGPIHAYGTPRRIIVLIDEIAPREPDAQRVVRGPKITVAYDADGEPTKALEGFVRGQGVAIDDLGTAEFSGTEHVVHTVTETGKVALDVLSEVLAGVVAELRSNKNMRWSDGVLSFSRPIRWLVALLGDVVVPMSVSSLTGGRTTRVHRTADEPVINVMSAADYIRFLSKHGIVADESDRRSLIIAAAEALAADVAGRVDIDGESALIDEITNLVEEPTALLGGFDPRYLELPEPILTTVMRKHQRYLPVRSGTGDDRLLPYFITVANGACDRDVVRAGNESVLTARYEDATFFWRADLEVPLETFRANLEKLTFEERLGSMSDRADRLADVAARLAEDAGIDGDDAATAQRAGALAKFDLASRMVVELSSLAGVMAREYASRAGESEAVATALFEMELPRQASGPLPGSLPGAVLALADRFDLLAAMFAVGAKPTGSSDPFGLRRASLGVVRILRDETLGLTGLTVSGGLAHAAGRLREQGVEVPDDAVVAAQEFVTGRFAQQLRNESVPAELVTAVLPGADDPGSVVRTLDDLQALAGDQSFQALVAAVQRAARILPPDTAATYNTKLLTEPAEKRLIATAKNLGDYSKGSIGDFAEAGASIVEPINDFFTDILVMADDKKLRAARLGLVAAILEKVPSTVDWSALKAAAA